MGLFQKTVVQKYLKQFDAKTLENKYNEFIAHFGKPEIQENIRNSKEEQYQEGFLRDLFVNILGYTLNPNTNYNLITENKNLKDSKKADGAIILESKVKAVIELKGTDTTDLAKVENQAFGYKNNQIGCVYVITSNFEKLRFYIEDATNFEEFNLFTLTHEQFNLFYLCLSFDSISKGLPLAIKHESTSKEEQITNDFYKAYSTFKRDLYQNLVIQNPQFDPLLLFKKSQKLLDRFLFLFFAEDRLLLPPNSVRLILNDWRELQERDVQIPLYDRYKKYFEYLNTGYKGKRYDVFAYNGGLFKPDEVLDTVTINDDLLYKHTLKLSEYDFVSEVDVNILGHIFENSLNEIDEIKADLEGTAIDKTKTKRKKDGVFYTPKYITKYIVENTVGKLCTDKKNEFGIKDEDYITDKKRQTNTKKALLDKLAQYRQWLLQITICDPACGSGAFLNQALDFLITEHQYIDELQAKIYGASIIFSDVEKSILENNIYGVDLNEESVEIAKLSLWLRTAQPNRKLNDLNNNIKCGNSLIDSHVVAGDKAFNWRHEFPKIFDNGGFDVVIGNPPYVQSHSLSDSEKEYIYANFKTAEYQINTYGVFVEQFIELLKTNSYYSLIIPNYWLSTKYDKLLRRKVFIENHALEVINTYEVFESATVDTLILTGEKCTISTPCTSFYSISRDYKTIEERLKAINLRIWEYSEIKQFVDGDEELTIGFSNKLKLSGEKTLKDYFSMFQGMKPYEEGKGTPSQTREMMNEKVYHSSTKIDDSYFPLLGARHIQRHYLVPFSEYIKYGNNLAAPRKPEIFKGERILINRILSKNCIDGVLVSDTYINNTDVFNLIPIEGTSISIKVLYALIVSKLCATYLKNANVNLNRNAFPKINVNTLESFPVPEIPLFVQTQIDSLSGNMIIKTNELHEGINKFIGLLHDNFELPSVPKRIEAFYELEFKEFNAELKKLKINLTLSQQSEWKDFFEQTKTKMNLLQSDLVSMDNEIENLIYQLYGLSNEEIEIIENSVK